MIVVTPVSHKTSLFQDHSNHVKLLPKAGWKPAVHFRRQPARTVSFDHDTASNAMLSRDHRLSDWASANVNHPARASITE